MKTSLRILNKKSSILGLTVEDLILVGTVHFIIQSAFAALKFQIDLYILIFSCSLFIGLSVIRLKFRRHIIRDSVKYANTQILKGGVGYDSSSYRYRKN